MSATPLPAMSRADRANSRNALIAGFLGWTLDAFDFFILTYVLTQIAAEFHKSVAEMTLTITASLVMRPVGAILFGLMADRYGRRIPLMVDVIFYSVVEVATSNTRRGCSSRLRNSRARSPRSPTRSRRPVSRTRS